MRRTTLGAALGAGALMTAVVAAAPPAMAAPPPLPPGISVLAGGFVNPAHVSFGPHGTLFVADMATGSVTRIMLRTGAQKVVGTGLGLSAGVDVDGAGRIFATSVLGDPETEAAPARLVRIGQHGHITVKADLLAWELKHNPDGQSQAVDSLSNPYGVLALPHRVIVADAGANDLIEVRSDGRLRTLTVFPNFTDGECATRPENTPGTFGCDAVPTDVEMGPDGYLYVSGLGAFAQGHIYKVNARTGKIVRTWGGLPPLTGLAIGRDGTIYAASFVSDTVLRIRHGDVDVATVPAPTDIELGHGMIVVASFAGAIFRVAPNAFHD
jgi:sugar lactone lactonase YvrE